MKRNTVFLMVVMALLPFYVWAAQPNVVIIITDDQSWDSLGYMGGDVHTPRIDRMAREGLIFSD
ncbi:MAG: sulfatase-like hydrolase/transferase, partial [Planctomycetes bacterium]|nr:sulfatase-like hydrolase/transferase [Planctomycetota bacterium]